MMHAHCRRDWQPSLAMPRRRDDSVGAAPARRPAAARRRWASGGVRPVALQSAKKNCSTGVPAPPAAARAARFCLRAAQRAASVLRARCIFCRVALCNVGQCLTHVPAEAIVAAARERGSLTHTRASSPPRPPRSRSLSIRHHVEGRHGVHRRGGRQGALQEARQRGAAHHVRARAGLPVAAGAPRRAPRHAVIPPLPAQAVDV